VSFAIAVLKQLGALFTESAFFDDDEAFAVNPVVAAVWYLDEELLAVSLVCGVRLALYDCGLADDVAPQVLVAWVEEMASKVNLVLWKVAEEDACPVSALSTLKHLRYLLSAKIKRELLFTTPRKRQKKDKKTPLIMRSAFRFYPL